MLLCQRGQVGLIGSVEPGNLASERLLVRAGFSYRRTDADGFREYERADVP